MASQEISRALATLLIVLCFGLDCQSTCANPTATNDDQHQASVRVMSFNIRFGKAEDGPNHWRQRKELVLKTVRDFDPDILGTQEMMLHQAKFFRQHLNAYEYHGTSRIPSNIEEEQCAVFYRKERFEQLAAGHFWLSESPDVPGSKSWDAMFPRMVSWVELRERSQPAESLFVFNTHFDHVGKEARLQSAAILRQRIQTIAGESPVVVMGDFNSDDGSVPHQILLAHTNAVRLSDTFRVCHPEAKRQLSTTTSGWNGNRSGRRIDWVLASPHWQVINATIDRSNDDGRYPSDHYPVTAVLSLIEDTASTN